MGISRRGLVYGGLSPQFGIRSGPVPVQADRLTICMRCPAVDLGIAVSLPKYPRAGSPYGVSVEGCVPVQLFEIRGVARRSPRAYPPPLRLPDPPHHPPPPPLSPNISTH